VIAYAPTPRRITVDMTKISGKEVRAVWFNPRTGKSESAGEFPTSGKHPFNPPGEGDWVLLLDDAARKLPAPAEPSGKL